MFYTLGNQLVVVLDHEEPSPASSPVDDTAQGYGHFYFCNFLLGMLFGSSVSIGYPPPHPYLQKEDPGEITKTYLSSRNMAGQLQPNQLRFTFYPSLIASSAEDREANHFHEFYPSFK